MTGKLRRQDVRAMLRQIMGENPLDKRRIEIMSTTSHGNENYRTWFFHVEGSPAMAIGYITGGRDHYEMQVDSAHCSKKKYYFCRRTLKLTTFRQAAV